MNPKREVAIGQEDYLGRDLGTAKALHETKCILLYSRHEQLQKSMVENSET